jgi:hypothetical protein
MWPFDSIVDAKDRLQQSVSETVQRQMMLQREVQVSRASYLRRAFCVYALDSSASVQAQYGQCVPKSLVAFSNGPSELAV